MIKWHTQAGNITNNMKVEIDFTLTEFGATCVISVKFTDGCDLYELSRRRS